VAAGRGWSIVPDHCATRAARTRMLRHPRRRVRNRIYVVTRAGARDDPEVTTICEALRSASPR
jgi:DNA-binding transcriptional LysR family regulator